MASFSNDVATAAAIAKIDFPIEKLVGEDNFPVWKWTIKNFLGYKGLEEYLDRTPDASELEKIKVDKFVCAIITTALDTKNKQLILGCSSAKAMWDRLKTMYDMKSKYEKQELYAKLHSFKFEGAGTIIGQLTELSKVVGQLKDMGTEVPDDQLVAIVYNALPAAFNNFKTSYKVLPEKDQNYETLVTRIMAEAREIQKDSANSVMALYSQDHQGWQATYEKGRARQRSRERPDNRRHHSGNRQSNRSQSRERYKQRIGSSDSRGTSRDRGRSNSRDRRGYNHERDKSKDVCNFCKNVGHWKKDCRKLARKLADERNEERAFLSSMNTEHNGERYFSNMALVCDNGISVKSVEVQSDDFSIEHEEILTRRKLGLKIEQQIDVAVQAFIGNTRSSELFYLFHLLMEYLDDDFPLKKDAKNFLNTGQNILNIDFADENPVADLVWHFLVPMKTLMRNGVEEEEIGLMAVDNCNNRVAKIGSEQWLADSGASKHMTGNRHWLNDYRKLNHAIEVIASNDTRLHAIGVGKVQLENGCLEGVFHVPGMITNLFSISAVTNHGYQALYSGDKLQIIKGGKVYMEGYKVSGVYILDIKVQPANQLYANCTWMDWHQKLGHISGDIMQKMISLNAVEGINSEEIKYRINCYDCMINKCKRSSHPSRTTARATKPGLVLHVDTVGPIKPRSIGNSNYFVLCRDEHSSYRMVRSVFSKAEVKEQVKIFVSRAKLETLNDVCAVKSDNGTEFVNKDLACYLNSKGIEQLFSAPYTPNQNGYIERDIRTVTECARTMLNHSKLPNLLWTEAIATAVYLLNRVINKRSGNRTPHEIWTGRRPNLKDLKIFGQQAIILSNASRNKFEQKGFKVYFVGYTDVRNTFRFYDPVNMRIITTSDATFLNDVGGLSAIVEDECLLIDFEIPRFRVGTDVNNNSSIAGQQEHENYWPTEIHVVQLGNEENRATSSDGRVNTDPMYNNVQQEIITIDDSCEEQATNTRSQQEQSHVVNEQEVEVGTEHSTVPGCSNVGHTQVENNNRSLKEVNISNFGIFKANTKSNMLFNLNRPARHVRFSESTTQYYDPENNDIDERLFQLMGVVEDEDVIECQKLLYQMSAQVDLGDEPKTYKEVMNRPDKLEWEKAMQDEIKSLDKNNVWILVPRAQAKNVVKNRWVYRIKRKPSGEIDRYKARLVAKGFSQKEGVDYNETYAPVANMSTLRLLFAYAAQNGLHMRGFDVKTAFLYGDLEEENYMEQPEGFKTEENMVCLLKKSLYGLKQSPRQWNKKFSDFLKSNGLVLSENDRCVFYSFEPLIIIAIYVDDGIIFSSTAETADTMVRSLKNNFDIHEVSMNSYLGFQIERNSKGIIIHQESYIKKVLKKFDMLEANIVDTPCANESRKSDESEPLKEHVPYREAVGCLMYAAVITRIDIAYAVNKVSRKVANPTINDWIAVKRIFRYLAGTIDRGIRYRSTDVVKHSMQTYCDSDYAGCIETSRSTTGLVIVFAGGPIHWRSHRQKLTTLSSTEAELVGVCTATQDTVWIRKIAKELKIISNEPTILFCDNTSAIRLATNEKSQHRTRHMMVRAEYPREMIKLREITVKHVRTENQLADMLTKPMTGSSFRNNREQLSVPKHLFITMMLLLTTILGVCMSSVRPLMLSRGTHKIAFGKRVEMDIKIVTHNPCNQFEYWSNSEPYPSAIANCRKLYRSEFLDQMIELSKANHKRNQVLKNELRSKRQLGAIAITLIVFTNLVSSWTKLATHDWWDDHQDEFLKSHRAEEKIFERTIESIKIVHQEVIELRKKYVELWGRSYEIAWATSLLINQIYTKGLFLRSLVEKANRGIVGTKELGSILNYTEIKHYTSICLECVDERFTEFQDLSVDNSDETMFTLKFALILPNEDYMVLQTDAFSYWDQIHLDHPKYMIYAGPKYYTYNVKENCKQSLSDDIPDVVVQKCVRKNYIDKKLLSWVPDQNNRTFEQATQFKSLDDFNYILCYPGTITIRNRTQSCANNVIILPTSVSFNTSDNFEWYSVNVTARSHEGWSLAAINYETLNLEQLSESDMRITNSLKEAVEQLELAKNIQSQANNERSGSMVHVDSIRLATMNNNNVRRDNGIKRDRLRRRLTLPLSRNYGPRNLQARN